MAPLGFPRAVQSHQWLPRQGHKGPPTLAYHSSTLPAIHSPEPPVGLARTSWACTIVLVSPFFPVLLPPPPSHRCGSLINILYAKLYLCTHFQKTHPVTFSCKLCIFLLQISQLYLSHSSRFQVSPFFSEGTEG